jgi:hypothetical protein
MAQSVIQHSFSSGEWAPNLNARVDLQKYHAGAALLRNFFVDYRGGASSRMGTKYVLQAFKSATAVRLIAFAASSTVQYVLEFGDKYIRFFFNGAPVLESAVAITGVTNANPAVVSATNTYSAGDWVYIIGVGGTTQLNGNYYQILSRTGGTITLGNILGGSNVNSTAYGVYTSGGTVQRVYKITSPYAAADLALLKFTQIVNEMVICHPAYAAQVLTLTSAASWAIANLSIGPTINPPSAGLGVTTSNSGTINVSYIVTSVDTNGQESSGSTVQATTINAAGIVTTTVSWSAVTGAVSYNIYRAVGSVAGVVPANVAFGFIGNTQGISFVDTFSSYVPAIASNFSEAAPIFENPFGGGPVTSITLLTNGIYTNNDTFPTVSITAPASGTTATATIALTQNTTSLLSGGQGFIAGEVLTVSGCGGLQIQVVATGASGTITSYTIVVNANLTSGTIPQSGVIYGGTVVAVLNINWKAANALLTNGGSGYSSGAPPSVTITGINPATASSTVLSSLLGAPALPGFYQQRLVLAAPTQAPQSFFMSQPGAPFNFNISFPEQADDSITASIVSGQLNTIKSMFNMPTGLIMMTDRQAWLVNGGSAGAAITPIDAQAQGQAYNGASDLMPLVINYDALYVQAKGSIVRDLTFNFYTGIYTGTDVTVLSNHLFYGYTITSWAWCEEPFKTVWAVRNEGTLLSLTFIKEQEIVGWAHHDTQGSFTSNATVVESITTPSGSIVTVDAHYVVVQRVINGNTVQYIERMADRFFNGAVKNAWCVDAGLQYSAMPATVFSGLLHLIGATVTGLADGVVIPSTTVSATGTVTLSTAASLVTIGLAFTPQLQTLRLDVGEPTQQGKRKKIAACTTRVSETLGLSIGSSSSNLVAMKDLVVGNVGSASNTLVTDLVTDDARTNLDPTWTVAGQYFFQQSNPMPVTILGVIPEIILGDS